MTALQPRYPTQVFCRVCRGRPDDDFPWTRGPPHPPEAVLVHRAIAIVECTEAALGLAGVSPGVALDVPAKVCDHCLIVLVWRVPQGHALQRHRVETRQDPHAGQVVVWRSVRVLPTHMPLKDSEATVAPAHGEVSHQ